MLGWFGLGWVFLPGASIFILRGRFSAKHEQKLPGEAGRLGVGLASTPTHQSGGSGPQQSWPVLLTCPSLKRTHLGTVRPQGAVRGCRESGEGANFSPNPPEPRSSRRARPGPRPVPWGGVYGRLAKVFPNNNLLHKSHHSKFVQGDRNPK